MYTIYDAGGNDTIDASSYDKAVKINLNDGAFSSIGENGIGGAGYEISTGRDIENVAIAYGTEIENAIGTSQDDLIIGNEKDNEITGGLGSDVIDGGLGVDTVKYDGTGGLRIKSDIEFFAGGDVSQSDPLSYSVIDLESANAGDTDTISNVEIFDVGVQNITIEATHVDVSAADGFSVYGLLNFNLIQDNGCNVTIYTLRKPDGHWVGGQYSADNLYGYNIITKNG